MVEKYPYDRKDYYSILSFLKSKAYELSDGRWSDFSDADIGTVFLKVMSMLADMSNYSVDRGINELYLETATDRASLMSMCKLIGYKPHHFQSAYTYMELVGTSENGVPDNTVVRGGSSFTNQENSIRYTCLEDSIFINNRCRLRVFEGKLVEVTKSKNDISKLGRIYLDDYEIGENTVHLDIDGRIFAMVDDVRYSDAEQEFSIHLSEDKTVYIQLPPFWSDIVTDSSIINISYLLSNGLNGRIGENVLTKIEIVKGLSGIPIEINSNEVSQGGYNPETISDIKESAPEFVRTMDTLVTKNDFKELVDNILGISDVVALDYNDEESGLRHPDDAYQLNLYVLPEEGNSIIKEEKDWTEEDRDLLIKYGIQPLTELGNKVRKYVDERRLSSIQVNYVNVEVLNPGLVIDIYMDKNNLKYEIMSGLVQEFLFQELKRGKRKIGQSLYASVIGSKILKEFPDIDYCEVRNPIEKIQANKKQFINIDKNMIRVVTNTTE